MNKIDFKNLPDTSTPLSAENLNQMQDNIESGITDAVNTGISGDLVVDSIKSKNMFQNGTSAWGYSYGITLKTNEDGSLSITGTQTSSSIYFVDVRRILKEDIKNGNYTISFHNENINNISYRLRKYDGSTKTVIKSETVIDTANYSFTIDLNSLIDNNTKWVELDVISASTTTKNVLLYPQIEYGSTTTSYRSYQKLNDMDIYIKGEQRIGTWLDKPLYRNVIEATPNINATTTSASFDINIANVDQVFILPQTKVADSSSSGWIYNFPSVHSNTGYVIGGYIIPQASKMVFNIRKGNAVSFYAIRLVIEYTKTTD